MAFFGAFLPCFLKLINDAGERILAPPVVGGWFVMGSERGVFSLSEAREEIAVAVDLPRDWAEVPVLADCVDVLVDACFVESSSCSLSWREEMLDPGQVAWSEAVVESGILSALEFVSA